MEPQLDTRGPGPGDVSLDEVSLAARNHGMPLEALRYDLTPVGLHYLLVHYDIPAVDPAAWTLEIDGHVRTPLRLTLEDLLARPQTTRIVTLECAGNGRALLEPRAVSQPWLLEAVGTAAWTGVPLAGLLEEAGVLDDAVDVVFRGLDRGVEGGLQQDYERGLPVGEAMREEILLAHAMNGAPLLPQHGFPLRLVVPGWYGMASVKWLTQIRVLDEPFAGYQNVTSYRWRAHEDDPGAPIDRIHVRSLMAPPGIPAFLPRTRHVDAGETELRGRAWSGAGAIERVEVSDDGGATWHEAELDPVTEPFAWRGWRFRWRADPGEHVLCCRATDATGDVQPMAARWNVGGYTNNAVQRVDVVVAP